MKFYQKLKELGACPSAIEWAGDKTLRECWNTCERGDWMLWLYARMLPDNLRELTLAKAHCANTVRHLMRDERSQKAIDVAIAYGEGKATRKELYAANYAAYVAAYATTYAVSIAAADVVAATDVAADAVTAYAASVAANAVGADAVTAYAVSVAANAASVAAADVTAFHAARRENLKQTAEICRKYLKLR